METWKIQLLQMVAQGAVQAAMASEWFMNDQVYQQLLLWERGEALKRERDRILIGLAVYLAENGELTPSKTESIMMARRSEYEQI